MYFPIAYYRLHTSNALAAQIPVEPMDDLKFCPEFSIPIFDMTRRER